MFLEFEMMDANYKTDLRNQKEEKKIFLCKDTDMHMCIYRNILNEDTTHEMTFIRPSIEPRSELEGNTRISDIMRKGEPHQRTETEKKATSTCSILCRRRCFEKDIHRNIYIGKQFLSFVMVFSHRIFHGNSRVGKDKWYFRNKLSNP